MITIHGGDIYRHKDVIDFSSNCNPYGTPEGVKKAVCAAAEKICCYPDTEYSALKEALSAYEGVPEEELLCGNGAADLIFALAVAVKPKKALLPVPTFAEYGQALSAAGCSCRNYSLNRENGFRMTAEILQEIDEDMDMMFLCNPNNPTGVLTEQELLLAVAEKCRRKGVLLVLDECFVDFIDEPEENTLKGRLKEYPNLVILKAFTKRYAMAGIRLGYVMSSNRELLLRLREVMQPWSVSIPAQEAGVAALKEEAYAERTIGAVRAERKVMLKALQDCGYRVYASAANYIFFEGPKDLDAKCLAEGILIRDCSNYEGLEKGYYRVAVKRPEENRRLLDILKREADKEGEKLWQK